MTSPAGPDILARWTPSRTRAGVILHPASDSAGSLRYVTAQGPAPQMPEDSFASDSFAPLSASTDSSLIGAEGCERLILGDVTFRPTNGELSVPTAILQDQFDKLETMANEDLPIMMKLEQLRKWQQEMQKQLEAHQLEELLCLQEEQQRLLGIGNDPRHSSGESTEFPEPEWDEETVHYRPDENISEVPLTASGVRSEQQQLSKDQEKETWNSEENEWRRRADGRGFPEPGEAQQRREDAASAEGRHRKGDQVWNERPIKPGLVGQKQTFEELLEEQLRLEEQRLKSARQQQNPAPPKRAFLKRGEGLARFTHNSKASSKKAETRKDQKSQLQARVITRSNSAPASIHKGFSNSSPRLPVQRKTAILNKENQVRGVCSSPREIRADGRPAWTKVLGTHQQQNKEESVKTEPESGRNKNALLGLKNDQTKNKMGFSDQGQRSCAPNKQPNQVTKQVGATEARGNADGDAARTNSSGSTVEATPPTEKEGGAPQDSFEVSFQEKLRRWECDKHLENMELGEFELLEQAAEELSFSSNSSFVTKVLRMDQQNRQLQTAQALHQRRLSSTPIKSPPRGEPQKCGSVERDAASVCHGGSTASHERRSVVVDEVNAEDDDDDDGGEDVGREDQRELSDVSSAGGSDFEEQDAVLFPALSNPPYDKRSYQEEDSFRDSASDGGEGDSVHSCTEDSTLTEDKDGRQPDVIFDDDDTWNDLEVSAGGKSGDLTLTSRPAAAGGKPLMRKVAASKAAESDSASEADPPPASQLMTRLFPTLKPKDKSAPAPPPPVVSESSQQSNDTVQQAQSRQLRERLVELEIEIERFKKENAALAKLRQDHEKKQEELRRERSDFDQAKAAELARFEDYKKEENKKLQRERKLFEKHALAARAAPDKKEREEIQSLKEQLNSVQEELKRRESRWTATHTRLRQQIDSLNKDNAALREEIQMLEKLRLNAWRKSSIAAEPKDSPRTWESSGSSGTKGVTFASPLDSIGSCSSPPAGSTSAGIRGNCKDSSQGIKSSLRRSGGSTSSFSSSSSSLTARKQEGRSSPSRRSQQPPQTLEESEEKTEVVPEQPQSAEAAELDSVQEVIKHPDGKIEKVLVGGDRLVVFPNGTRKEVSADGLSVKITFFNGDTKQITADQRVIYYYAEAQTTHITYPEGLEVLHFPNNQTEKHFPDGHKEITFPDQTVKNLFPDGREESVLTDGTIIRVNTDGIKEIHFNTGQKEVHTADFKRREYPDGTLKTVYSDGRQETRYPTGRVRIKDKEGNVVMDKRP